MSDDLLFVTPQLHQTIVAYLRASGFPHVAAEAAGVPRRVFARWLRQGRRADASVPLRAFAAAVREAGAQARLKAELEIFQNKPLDWLKSGPGKGRPRDAGWTAPARAAAAKDRDFNPYLHPGLQRAFAELIAALAPFPEAGAAAADALDRLSRRPSEPAPGGDL